MTARWNRPGLDADAVNFRGGTGVVGEAGRELRRVGTVGAHRHGGRTRRPRRERCAARSGNSGGRLATGTGWESVAAQAYPRPTRNGLQRPGNSLSASVAERRRPQGTREVHQRRRGQQADAQWRVTPVGAWNVGSGGYFDAAKKCSFSPATSLSRWVRCGLSWSVSAAKWPARQSRCRDRRRGASRLSQGCTGQWSLVENERFTGELPPLGIDGSPPIAADRAGGLGDSDLGCAAGMPRLRVRPRDRDSGNGVREAVRFPLVGIRASVTAGTAPVEFGALGRFVIPKQVRGFTNVLQQKID